MSRYRKKPVEVEAMGPLVPRNAAEIAVWCGGKAYITTDGKSAYVFFPTPEGQVQAERGDYVIRGVKGEFARCKPDMFDAAYEPVEADR